MGLHLIAASFDYMGYLETIWNFCQVALGLGFVIFVHELGHFAVAKMCGVKCEKFYVGFDVPIKIGPLALPRTLGKFQWGETEYGIGIIPLGGYVKMLGQDDNPMNAEQEAERIRVEAANDAEASADPDTKKNGDAKLDATTKDVEKSSLRPEFDPRSYPAKPVWQRMCIISAGVIMNVIFGVIFATIAYMMGVLYTPCVVGNLAPGEPAWASGMNTGDEIVSLYDDLEPREHLRFDFDLRPRIAHAGLNATPKPVQLQFRRPSGEVYPLTITPAKKPTEVARFATIGVAPRAKTTIGAAPMAHTAAGRASKSLQSGDRIVAVDGTALHVSRPSGDIYDDELDRVLTKNLDQPVTLTVERETKEKDSQGNAVVETFESTVEPSPMQSMGLVMKTGPIVAIRAGSPASEAGFEIGDVVTQVNGEPVGDPMTLQYRFRELIDQAVTFEVARGDGSAQEITSITVTPTGEFMLAPMFGSGSFLAIENVGIAYAVTLEVASVVPDTPAAKAGIQAGDVLSKMRIDFKEGYDTKPLQARMGKRILDEFKLTDDAFNFQHVHSVRQRIPMDLDLIVTYARGDKEQTATFGAVESDEYFNVDRGFPFVFASRVHTAKSLKEAFFLGIRESKEKGAEVLSVLGKLVTGRLSFTNLGGPLTIFRAAGSEASVGLPRLLVFLTFLSVNLAILNFMPIPALDGGHMVFLFWELVTGRPPNEKVQGILTLVGVGLLLCLMIFVFTNDIFKLF